ncbi:AraC family transcriptional regulator ligand-binding domain-containing protein [Arhodomonas sp. AD133]|uniref:AraC family transcriptional regulator ligand-binding domain-containing protein n=1 Tax=Arhodomonas sp. AD133 TaxID=3415009 RepID=UPI003EB9B1D9
MQDHLIALPRGATVRLAQAPPVARPWLENTRRFIGVAGHVALLLDLLVDRGIDPNHLLRGTRVFRETLHDGNRRISPLELARIFGNAARLSQHPDCSFVLGQRLWPGIFNHYSAALLHAPDLATALRLLADHSDVYFPLLKPRLLFSAAQCHVLFEDAFGVLGDAATRRFAVETWMSAVVSLADWLGGHKLSWQARLSHSEPAWLEQYEVALGPNLSFGYPYCALSINQHSTWLAWPRASKTAFRMAASACRVPGGRETDESLLTRVREFMLADIQRTPSLPELAEAFGMSPATLKRQFGRHNTAYQKLADGVRRQLASFLMQDLRLPAGAVADCLGYHDTSNFRRSLRRWACWPSAARHVR